MSTDWQPGDHLYDLDVNPHTYSRYIFNFRDDADGPECRCGDAASWPEPRGSHHRVEPDPLAGFVAEWRAWAAAGRPGDGLGAA